MASGRCEDESAHVRSFAHPPESAHDGNIDGNINIQNNVDSNFLLYVVINSTL